VDWALEMGVDAAYVGRPDSEGWIRAKTERGGGMREYLEHARISILDANTQDSSAVHAWQTQQVQVATHSPSAARATSSQASAHAMQWRVQATIPLCRGEHSFGLFALYSSNQNHFVGADWVDALAHVSLIASTALNQLHLETEQDRLHDLTLRDPLTGIPNRTALDQHLERAVSRALRSNIPLVIGLLDLDKFKPINDLFGHDAGDRALQEMATRLQSVLRASDFVARLGGDEFVFVLEGIQDPAFNLNPFLDRLRARLEEPMRIGHASWQCGASLGLTLCPSPSAAGPRQALLEADQALRSSKAEKDRGQRWWCWASSSHVCEPTIDTDSTEDPSHLYSSTWGPGLISLTEALQRNAAHIVNRFYDGLKHLPKSKQMLEALSEPEVEHLKSQQIQNLFALSSPNLSGADHRAMALRVGRIHAIVGLDREDLVRSRGILVSAIYDNLEATSHAQALSTLNRRLTRDLAYQIEAYQHLQNSRQDVLLDVARLAWEIDNYTDLINQVVAILGKHDEVAGCSVGRPDSQGKFRFESASGKTIEKYLAALENSAERLTTQGDQLQGQGPTGRAWRSGKVERTLNVATDPRMTPWRAYALRDGFRSSVAIPLSQPGCAPMAILSLYSAFPGGYAAANQVAFVELLQTLLGFAIARIESLEGRTDTVPYAMRLHWVALLRSDALQMHYQPLLDLKTGQITKVEALARLRDGDRMVMPGEFFPALSSGDFLELYVRGLSQALAQRTIWLQSGINLNVSVNLPSSALSDSRYLDATRQILKGQVLAPDSLTLEILETDALPSGIDVLREMTKFKELGIKLAEDDLGSGHSSLSRLRELPFDYIKIDRNIVSLAGQDASDVLRFIYQLTRLGHSLGKSVVVEGVENADLLEATLILGADVAQGYAIARPMSPQQLATWIHRPPAVPDSHNPKSTLGKLAKLLIWEERLHLLSQDRPAFCRLANVIETPANAAAIACAIPAPLASACQTCPFSTFFIEMKSILPDGLADPTVQHALIAAAVTDGPRSTLYRALRERLVTAITSSGGAGAR